MLVRKINKAKWFNDGKIIEDPSADAMTNCLKTTQNTLSVWLINSETEIEDAVLAIVSGQDHLETIDIVMLEDEYFIKCEIRTEETEGLTPVFDLRNKHRDLASLDFWTLGMVAYHIIENIKKNKLQRFTEAKLKKIIKNAIANNRLRLTDLKEDIQKKVI
ncbi:MAG: hypothetical protein LBR26_17595 [Prevotella sp.]|jgi:hypothetical protein|nr:hypothetical protein [Prevotella sp.]